MRSSTVVVKLSTMLLTESRFILLNILPIIYFNFLFIQSLICVATYKPIAKKPELNIIKAIAYAIVSIMLCLYFLLMYM